MKRFFAWIRTKTIWLLSTLIALFGTISTRIVSCGTNTIVTTTQIVSNPNNQTAAVEAASFVANLFYEGADDPFPSPGLGGEAGKNASKVYRQGQELFGEAMIKIAAKLEHVIIYSRKWHSPQIQEGARAISKKIGHAQKVDANYVSVFENLPVNQKKAEELIHNIINQANIIVIHKINVRIFMENGMGVSIKTKNANFVGFVELQLQKDL